MTDVNAELDNFSNRLKELKEGDAVAKVTGLFMGTGRTVAAGTFGREIESRVRSGCPDREDRAQIVQ